jgi:hypothetical protein
MSKIKETLRDRISKILVETATEKYLQIIQNTLKGDKEYKGKYLMPYTDEDDYVDFIINYHVNKVSFWKTNGKNCQYEGVVYVKIDNLMVGFEGTTDWEKAKITDLPSWVEDDFKDSIQDELNIFDNICMDVDYD